MDPEEALRQLRALAAASIKTEDQGGIPNEMAEPFQALDEWIIKGGFLPSAWVDGENRTNKLRVDEALLELGLGFTATHAEEAFKILTTKAEDFL